MTNGKGVSPFTLELSRSIAKHAPGDGAHETAIASLRLFRSSTTTGPVPSVFEPVLCVLAQGRKQLLSGRKIYAYTPEQFAIVTTDIPLAGQITRASRDAPYLGLRLAINFSELSTLIPEALADRQLRPAPGIVIGAISPLLLDALVRLVRILDYPQHIRVLSPMIEREILYLLLQSEAGTRLQDATRTATENHGLGKVIQRLQRDYKKPLRVSALVALSQQSDSTFHRQFQRVTGLTPLQYQKRLRLQEARRLMLATSMNVSSAAYSVGYQSVNQFNREYHRVYGEAPSRDLKRLRVQENVIA